MWVLELRDLYKGFAGEEGFRPVLGGVSLQVARGELVTLLGRSGCGKTTLLRIGAGFETPDRGEALLDGVPITGPSPQRMVVFQSFDQLFPWRRVRSNITFALGTVHPELSPRQAGESADFWLEETGLSGCGDRWPGELSGGMKQRAALARAFALEPELLLLDEPFAGLDAVLRDSMQELLLRLCARQKRSALFVTHDIDEALRLCPSPAVMAADGTGIVRVKKEASARETIRGMLMGEK